jgi:hypothetical protein
MRCSWRSVAVAASVNFMVAASLASATTFTFATDPFAGSTAPTTPGRQVVGGEPFISFDPAADVFAFDAAVFAGVPAIQFVNDVASNIPATGVNTIVLETFDDDADPATAFNAGTAANLIAAQITSPGPGFFVYFNQGLDLPRLVYSTDLSDNTADLKILARMVNLGGQPGRDALPSFSAANFALVTPVPEPTSVALMAAGGAFLAVRRKRRGGA